MATINVQAGKILLVNPGSEAALNDENIVSFNFNVADAVFERSGPDIVITIGEQKTVIHNFFISSQSGELPVLQLLDGTQVSGKDFLLAYEPSFDVNAAAGPEAAPDSSGLNAYNDSAGQLVGGVESLGALGKMPGDSSGLPSYAEPLLQTPYQVAELLPTPTPDPSPGWVPDPDIITVNAGSGVVKTFIYGDSIPQNDYDALLQLGRVVKGGPGKQELIDDGTAYAIIGGNAYTDPVDNSWGDDKITVNAGTFSGSIEGGFGSDTVTVNANAAGFYLFGDQSYLGTNKTGGNDTLTINGNAEAGSAGPYS